jgi:hypothetical protein
MTFSLPAVVLGVVLVAIGLVWIGLLQRRQPVGQKTSLPTVALVPVALVIIGGGVLALQIFSGDPFAGRR